MHVAFNDFLLKPNRWTVRILLPKMMRNGACKILGSFQFSLLN